MRDENNIDDDEEKDDDDDDENMEFNESSADENETKHAMADSDSESNPLLTDLYGNKKETQTNAWFNRVGLFILRSPDLFFDFYQFHK